MSEYLLQMTGIDKRFGGVHALDHVNFAVRPGKVMCLAGENGCGKSTLVKIISGVYTRDEGEVLFEGKPIQHITPAEATRLGIQVIYQDLSIFPNLTVMENLAINSEITANRRIVNKKRWEQTAKEALSKIGYDIDLYAKMGDLSVADKQLVAICRALLFNAKLIIMDEPTTALTKKEVDALFKTVRQLRDSGIAIMFISHKTEEIFEISDDVCIMRNGKNVFSGPTAELTKKDFTYYMTGRELEDDYFVPTNISKEPVLKVDHLTWNGKFHDVSFDLRKGEILGITGLLGSGRTELALALFGLGKINGGTITLNGQQVKITSPIDAQKKRIGYVPEDRLTEGLCLRQPIADNIMLASLKQLTRALHHAVLVEAADRRSGHAEPRRAVRKVQRVGQKVFHRHRRCPQARLHPLRRQPAEDRAFQVAEQRPGRADPERPHRGRGHRRQAGHPRAGARPGQPGPGGHHHLRRPGRGGGQLQPGNRDEGRHHRGRNDRR